MPVVGSGHVHGVETLFLLQQLPEVGIRRAAFVGSGCRTFARAVVGFHQPFGRLASSHAETCLEAVRQMRLAGRSEILAPILIPGTEQPARLAQQSVRSVLDVVPAALIAIADRNHLNLGPRQQVHRHRLSLPSESDGGEIDLVARRDVARAAKNVPRNDHKRRRPGESPPRHPIRLSAFH